MTDATEIERRGTGGVEIPDPTGPEPVAETRASWERLGLPGLIDVHVHFHPPSIERAIWRIFDDAGPLIGRRWPIRYRGPVAERLALLEAFGVRRFPTLPYAHKPGVAEFLNAWSADFASEHAASGVLRSATLYPEPVAAVYVPALVADGVEIVKVHQQVGGFHLDDPLLASAWGVLEDAGTPVLVHAGSGPVGTPFTGPDSMARLLARHPRLTVIVAHLGAPECEAFARLAATHDRVYLDTSMTMSRFFADGVGVDVGGLVPLLRDLRERVLFGSDFPTLPLPYVEQLDTLATLAADHDLGDDWLRAVLWHNGSRLLGPPAGGPGGTAATDPTAL